MDRKTLYDKAEKAIHKAFEIAKTSVRVVSAKAGEAAQVTKLLIEKASLEHRLAKRFTELGYRVYQKAGSSEGSIIMDEDIRSLVKAVQKVDKELSEVEALIEKERQTKGKKKISS